MSTSIDGKPKVLALMPPVGAGEEYMTDFKNHYILDYLTVKTHDEAIPAIHDAVQRKGPYQAFMIFMGTAPFEPFDFFDLLGSELKIIVSSSAGYNEFPIDWLTEKKIWFCNTKHAVAEPTADMAIFLTLATIRDTSRAEKNAREGRWRADHAPSNDPTGLVLGILGLGAIGKHLARKAAAFNLKVQYYNRHQLSPSEESALNVTYCPTMSDLLSTSDVLSINCPLTPSTHHLISHPEFAQMKQGVFIVNTARGPIIDESALISALESGKVARAGLDVFETEPKIHPYFVASEKCILQPHLGGVTTRARKDAEIECFENVKAYFRTGRPVAPVNEIERDK